LLRLACCRLAGHRGLHSFPTRRSSDLGPGLAEGHARAHAGRSNLVVVGALDTVPPPRRAPGDVTTLLYIEDYERARARYLRDPSDRKSTRLNSSHVKISYAVFCLKKKK